MVLPLFDAIRTRLEIDADTFIAKNPKVWDLFTRYAFQLIRAGRERGSVALIFERIRWYHAVETDSDDEFKLNNNHRATFARRFHEAYPLHDGFFETRSTAR